MIYYADRLPDDFPMDERVRLARGAWMIMHGRLDATWPSGKKLVPLFSRPLVTEFRQRGEQRWMINPSWTLGAALSRAQTHRTLQPQEIVQLQNAITGQIVVVHG